jgi:hypothetical protein
MQGEKSGFTVAATHIYFATFPPGGIKMTECLFFEQIGNVGRNLALQVGKGFADDLQVPPADDFISKGLITIEMNPMHIFVVDRAGDGV